MPRAKPLSSSAGFLVVHTGYFISNCTKGLLPSSWTHTVAVSPATWPARDTCNTWCPPVRTQHRDADVQQAQPPGTHTARPTAPPAISTSTNRINATQPHRRLHDQDAQLQQFRRHHPRCLVGSEASNGMCPLPGRIWSDAERSPSRSSLGTTTPRRGWPP